MKPPFTPFLFKRRGRTWTIVFPGPSGTKKQKALPYRADNPAHEVKAKKALALFIQRLDAAAAVEGDDDSGPMTVERWAKHWLLSREAKGISTVSDYRTRLRLHILPHIGHLRLDKVTPEHVVDVMAVTKKSGLAPRSQRHVYDTMVTMFNRAIPRLIAVNPCAIPMEDLPARQDADPEWRPTAIFERDEVVAILTSDAIPVDRRTIYAVMFLTGMRFGEISALHVRHYDPTLKPLGRLQVGLSYNSGQKRLKGTKTERPRLVPVHPWLARILDRWLAMGWREMMGRAPEPDDILFPTRNGTHRSRNNAYNQLNGVRPKNRARSQSGGLVKKRPRVIGDLERIGLRPRRQHDARRTFISLARGDGARKDLLRLVTHGPEGDIVDIYTEMPWAPLCEEVAKLKLAPPAPAPLSSLPNPAISRHPGLPEGCHPEKHEGNEEVVMVTPPGIEPARSSLTNNATAGQGAKPASALGLDRGRSSPKPAEQPSARSMATVATLALRQALAALNSGRIDVAKDVLERALAAEAEGEVSRAGDAS